MFTRRRFIKIGAMAGIGAAVADEVDAQGMGIDPRRNPAAGGDPQVRAAARHSPGDAAGRQIPGRCRRRSTTTRSPSGSSSSRSCPAGLPPDHRLELRRGQLPEPSSRRSFHYPALHDRGHGRRARSRVKWINGLVDANGNYLPHLLPVDPTLHWANPPGGETGRDMRPTFDEHARAVHRAGPDRHARPRRARPGGERRLRRGVVPAGRRRTSPAVSRRSGTLVRRVPRERPRRRSARLGAGNRRVPVPERPARHDALVPRPHAGHDAAERLRRAGRASTSCAAAPDDDGVDRGVPARTCPGPLRQLGDAPATRLLRDPDRHPGPVVQRRRLAVLSRTAASFFDELSPGPVSFPDTRRLADLEPGVLRQHDGGQRPHLAVPERRAAALPLPAS